MSILATPNHPARLAATFAMALAGAATVAAAAFALIWVVDSERDARSSDVAGISVPAADVDLPSGVLQVEHLKTLDAFEDTVGFRPVLAEEVPSTTSPIFVLTATMPDEQGGRIGQVHYPAAKDAAPVEGVTGPTIVLAQAQGEPSDEVDGVLKQLRSGQSHVLVATLACGEIIIDAQFYFMPDAPASQDVTISAYMRQSSQGFLDRLIAQCQ